MLIRDSLRVWKGFYIFLLNSNHSSFTSYTCRWFAVDPISSNQLWYLISDFSPSIGMENQSILSLFGWTDWLIDWMSGLIDLIFILLEWFWVVFAWAKVCRVASAKRRCSVPCPLHSWQFGKCSYSIFSIFSLLWLLTQFSLSVHVLTFCVVCLVHVLCFLYLSISICMSFPFSGSDYETEFDSERWAHCQSHQWVCEEARLHLLSQTGAHNCHAGEYLLFQFAKTSCKYVIGDTSVVILWFLPWSGFYQGRAIWCTADSSAPPCDEHMCQFNVSFT